MVKINQEIKKVIENNPLSFATIKGNKPYVIGVAYCKVIDNDRILITDNYMRTTLENIKKNPNVALVVWDKNWNGYQFLGKCKYYKRGKWLQYVKKMKENKGLPAKGAILIKVSTIIKSK
jgi:hypothetical protein